MSKKFLKWGLPVSAIALGIMGSMTISAIADTEVVKEAADTRPVVSIEALQSLDHQVRISSYGEVQPLESTLLSVQVSGEVTYWNPKFVTGGMVAAGDVLMRIEKDNYEAAVMQAEAELARAEAALIEEQANADVAADEAKRFPNKRHTDLFLRKPQLISAHAAVKSAKAGLKRAQRDLDNCEIVAPYNALITSREIGLGQFVSTGSIVAKLNNIESAEVIIPIAGFDSVFLPDRISGLPATIRQSGRLGFSRSAVVDRDLGTVDPQTRMSHLVVKINDPYGIESGLPELKFGSYVEVDFAGTTLDQIYRIPQDLVNNKQVWLINEDNQLEARQVTVLREDGAFLLISEGLKDKEKIVTTLPEYPQKGMAVRVSGMDESDSSASVEQL